MFVNCLQIDSWLDSSSKIICRFLWWITISLQIIWAAHSEQSQFGAHAVWVRCGSVKVTLPFSHWKILCNKPTAVRILKRTLQKLELGNSHPCWVLLSNSEPSFSERSNSITEKQIPKRRVADLRAWKHEQSYWRAPNVNLIADLR